MHLSNLKTCENWTKIEQKRINMSAYSAQSSTILMPVADLGNESFCGCYVASLTDTRAKKSSKRGFYCLDLSACPV
jgi:hypothetical protein